MKALIPLLLVSTSALAVTTVQYAHRASAERKRADEIFAVSQQHEARIAELEKERGALDRQLMEAQRPVMTAPASPPEPGNARMASVLQRGGPLAPEVPIATVRADAAAAGSRPVYSLSPWFANGQSPAAQRFLQWQRKASLRRQYADVGAALGLSQEQANKLIDALADEQTKMMTPPPNPPPKQQMPDRITALRAIGDAQKRTEATVAAVIGEDKLPQWEEYQKSMPERMRVSVVSEQMKQMDAPLTDQQRSQLVDIMVEQTQQNPRPTRQDGLSPEEMVKASMKWDEDSDKAFLERAKSVLTPDQFERYRDYQAWTSEMRANSLRAMQAQMANGPSPAGMVSFYAPGAGAAVQIQPAK